MKTIIIIPAYNEEGQIVKTISGLKHKGHDSLVVVDDGSRDKTYSLAKRHAPVVMHHAINRGLGAALGTGFQYAKSADADIVVTFDADGQHDAKDINRLIKPIVENKADVVIGSRFKDLKNIPFGRKIANILSELTTFMVSGVWTTDSQSGLRAFNRKALDSIQIKTDRMEVSSEFFREIGTNKLRLKEIPIAAIYTKYSLAGSKQGNIALASVKIGIKLIIRLFR